MYAYVGSRTTRQRNARGEGISVYSVDENEGRIHLIQTVTGLINPSFLAINRDNTYLYTVHGDQSEVSAFRIDVKNGQLDFINQKSCQGLNPVHLAFDPSEQFLVVSNHLTGTLAVINVHQDGALGNVVQTLALSGNTGPHRVEQCCSKPHYNLFSPDGRLVIVPDKGLDRIFSFHFEGGKLIPSEGQSVPSREAAGPRHAVFHPHRDFLYAINELDSTITVYRVERSTGELKPQQVITALPTDYTGNSRAAGIAISADGLYLYASNRGADNIAVFDVSPEFGGLKVKGFCPTQGKTPRFFTLTPNGKFIFTLNEDSDSIVSLKINPLTGIPEHTGYKNYSGSPVCMVFSNP
ncbi:MAG: lactonase family protein [Pantoea sp.]|uniref:lactonase family protein n=1 Tax=Pantoea sp. TaxID=69393 RepID=UPI0039E41F25